MTGRPRRSVGGLHRPDRDLAETTGDKRFPEYRHLMSAIEGRRSVAPPARHHRHLIVAAVAAALLLGSAGAAAADPPDYSLTVGIPDREAGPGLVDNRLRTGGGQILSEELLGLGDPSGSRFGAAMLV